jgi:hypothetical protein
MATRYLLTCSCGRELPIDAGQAGEVVRCSCGNSVFIPKLGELRLLPRVETPSQKSSWSARQGLLTLLALIAIVSLGFGVYYWIRTPARADYDASGERAELESFFKDLDPVHTWIYWSSQTVALARQGLQDEVTAQAQTFAHSIEQGEKKQAISFSIAGVAILLAIVVALWRRT